jgi:hypothetical protein
MAADFCAITAYFNPMRWHRRLANYRVFRRHLSIPLVVVELGYDGQYELTTADADILVQIPGKDVMWQKERLMNIALQAVPRNVERVACLDCDTILGRNDVWCEASRVLDRSPITQLFSHVFYLPSDHPLDRKLIQQSQQRAPGFAWLQEQGFSSLELCNPTWANPNDQPPVSYGLGWAFRRELFAERGFYDSWIVGGGTRLHFFAAHGHWQEAAQAFRFHSAMQNHFCRWASGFHAEVGGNWSYVPGEIIHLWHGAPARKKHRQRYEDFAQFDFDPRNDLEIDEFGAWRWQSNKPRMHQYLRDYIADRQEDGSPAESLTTAKLYAMV